MPVILTKSDGSIYKNLLRNEIPGQVPAGLGDYDIDLTGFRIEQDGIVGQKNGVTQVLLDASSGSMKWAAGKGILDERGIVQNIGGALLLSTPYGGIGTSQNYITYPEDFSYWDATNATITSNNSEDPTGDQKADRVVFTSNGEINISSFDSFIATNAFNFSIWVKASSDTQFKLRIEANASDYNEETFTATSEWQRFEIYCPTTMLPYPVDVFVKDNGSGSTLWLWGAQLEEVSSTNDDLATIYSDRRKTSRTYGTFFKNLNASNPILTWDNESLSKSGNHITLAGNAKFSSVVNGSDTFVITNLEDDNIFSINTSTKKVTIESDSSISALGAEKVTNGDFATSGTWTFGTGWAHDGTGFTAKHTAGNTAALEQSISITGGSYYLLSFQIKSRTAGSVYFTLGGISNAIYYKFSDSYYPLVSAGGDGKIAFYPSSDFDGSIDNVSIKQVTLVNSSFEVESNGTSIELRSTTKGVGIGENSLRFMSSDAYGGNNFGLGPNALANLVTGWRNTAIGDSALARATTSIYVVGIGYGALASLEGGGNSIAIGAMALNASKNSWNNVAIGGSALARLDGRNSDGNAGNNVAIGSNALSNQTTGYNNTAIGPYYELGGITEGVGNIGISSGNSSITSGNGNILIGTISGYYITTGSRNVAIGTYAIVGASGASSGNTSIGAFSGGMASGNSNTYVGDFAGYSSWSTARAASSNVMIGAETGYIGPVSNAVYIGYRAGYYETADERLFIDNRNRTDEATSRYSSMVYGEFSATLASQLFRVNGILQSLMTDGATNTPTTHLKLGHNSSGTPTADFGSRLLWELESSTAADQTAAYLDVLWADATHATRSAYAKLYTINNGSAVQVAKFGGTTGNVFNEEGTSWCDFRIEGDSSSNLFFVDASADTVGIGTSGPSTRLHVQQATSDISSTRVLLTIGHNSTGEPISGFGTSIEIQAQTDTTANTSAAVIEALWNTSSHSTRKADLVLSAFDTAKREGLRIRGSGSASAIGLYGVTPVIRATTSGSAATFVQNSGNAINDASTFDGYTIQQIVKALRNIGVLT